MGKPVWMEMFCKRQQRTVSPADSGWDLESGKLLKKRVVVRTGFSRLGNLLPSSWDPRCTTRGAIPSACHRDADELPKTRRAPSGLSTAAPSLLSHGARLQQALGREKVFQRMLATHPPEQSNRLIPTRRIGWKRFSLF